MAAAWKTNIPSNVKFKDTGAQDDSSESEIETEPAKVFHRRISTNKEIKAAVSIHCRVHTCFVSADNTTRQCQ